MNRFFHNTQPTGTIGVLEKPCVFTGYSVTMQPVDIYTLFWLLANAAHTDVQKQVQGFAITQV